MTIGLPCYDDFDGVYFSIQAIRLYQWEWTSKDVLVIDGHPDSPHGRATRAYCTSVGARYIPFGESRGPADSKNRVFKEALHENVLCMDSHVLLDPGAFDRLERSMTGNDLYQGPLIYDDHKTISTHFDPVWRGAMWGIWATDERGRDPEAEPFTIPAQGMGVFACKKDAWLGFNDAFSGFGGEECYIHEKFRQAGRQTWCLPFLRWHHRFGRPGGIPYKDRWEYRIRNYIIGHRELGLDPAPVIEHFTKEGHGKLVEQVLEELRCEDSANV